MASKRDHRFDEHHDYERRRYGQYNQRDQPEYYGERGAEGHRWDEPEWQRQRNEEPWSPREDYGRYAGERHYGQEQYRDRPYSGSSSYAPRGGYEGQHEPYREGREGYGATAMGTGWGSTDTGRHRLGSLTDSAADSAQHLAARRVSYAGRGPKGYKRSDERIREDVSEVLTRNHDVDATNIEVTVNDGIVVLAGTVDDRHSKRIAEDITQDVSGVRDVQNQIRVQPAGMVENKGPSASDTPRGSVLGLSAEAGRR